MKKLLLFFLVLMNLSIFGQTKHYFNGKGEAKYFTTIDTVMYFEFKDNCSPNSKSFFLDSLSKISIIDTIEENLFRIEFNVNKKNNMGSFFQSVETIKYTSFEYLNEDSVIHWTSGKIVLKIKDEVSIDSILTFQNINYISIDRDTFLNDYFTISLTEDIDPFAVSNQLYSTNFFKTVYPNFFFVIKMLDYEDNTYYNNQYYLNGFNFLTTYNGVNVKNAWEITTGNPNIKIAVLDNGVLFTHPDLENNLIYPGYDATVWNGSQNLYGGAETYAKHGTKTTGVIAAENNNIGIVGIAHTSKVFSIRMARIWRNAPPPDDEDPINWYTNENFIEKAFFICFKQQLFSY